MITPHEAAAFHGSAENAAYTYTQRLALALRALDFYAEVYYKLEDYLEHAESGADSWGTCNHEWLSLRELRAIAKNEDPNERT